MIFEALWESARKGELLLIDGGYCRYHHRRDGDLIIREIISLRPGAGQEILGQLRAITGVRSIVARCPVDLGANDWYARRGFICEAEEATKRGRRVNRWRLRL